MHTALNKIEKAGSWRKKAEKLHKKYNDLESLREHCTEVFGRNFVIQLLEPELVHVVPLEYKIDPTEINTSKDAPLYSTKNNYLQRIDTDKLIDAIVKKIKGSVTVEMFLADYVGNLQPDDLLEVYDRAVVRGGKVRESPGCYMLAIGGKRGRPMELELLGDR